MSGWRLFTGITGLLGQYLLCEALRRREPVAVLARGRRGVSAADRVDQLLATWEQRLGIRLQRPIVLAGELRRERVGLSDADLTWFRQNVISVVHCAASVRFQASASGEPMRTNVDGTRHLLEICRDSRTAAFHYISTAYSCGQVNRSASVLEELHSSDSPFGNVYERSKCLAEQLVEKAAGQFTRTIYRPSVIIGESDTGYSPSFNALYKPLQLVWTLLREAPLLIPSQDFLLQQLELAGDESRNLVPVDWVSDAIGSMIRDSSCHGGIYHLTNPAPTDGREIMSSMLEALSETISASTALAASEVSRTTEKSSQTVLAGFRQHMETYRSYFISDPVFDNSQFREHIIGRSCPPVTIQMLTRAFQYAIRAEFKDEDHPAISGREIEPRRCLEDVSKGSKELQQVTSSTSFPGNDRSPHDDDVPSATPEADFRLSLCLSGSGGGYWRISVGPSGIHCDRPTVEQGEISQLYGSATAFRAWLDEDFSLEDGIRSGLFAVTGSMQELPRVLPLMKALRSHLGSFYETPSDESVLSLPFVTHGGITVGSRSC